MKYTLTKPAFGTADQGERVTRAFYPPPSPKKML